MTSQRGRQIFVKTAKRLPHSRMPFVETHKTPTQTHKNKLQTAFAHNITTQTKKSTQSQFGISVRSTLTTHAILYTYVPPEMQIKQGGTRKRRVDCANAKENAHKNENTA